VEASFDTGSGGDVPDWDNTESRKRDEDAAWRDLVARFDVPPTEQESVPWPEREDMPPRSPGSQDTHEAGRKTGTRGADGVRGGLEGIRTDGAQGAFGTDGIPEAQDPDVIQAPQWIWGPGARRLPGRGVPASGTSASGIPGLGTPRADLPADDDDDHYIPPAPPPLPRLDPLAKGAWAALFGGPGYLVVATAAGWSVSGFAAFCAVAAFVAGFAILVLRMNEPGPGGPDDGDDGAVV
jgi:hypothetical protein